MAALQRRRRPTAYRLLRSRFSRRLSILEFLLCRIFPIVKIDILIKGVFSRFRRFSLKCLIVHLDDKSRLNTPLCLSLCRQHRLPSRSPSSPRLCPLISASGLFLRSRLWHTRRHPRASPCPHRLRF